MTTPPPIVDWPGPPESLERLVRVVGSNCATPDACRQVKQLSDLCVSCRVLTSEESLKGLAYLWRTREHHQRKEYRDEVE